MIASCEAMTTVTVVGGSQLSIVTSDSSIPNQRVTNRATWPRIQTRPGSAN
jgi:hypothetical protein